MQPFLGELSSNWSGVVEIDEFAVFPLFYISVSEGQHYCNPRSGFHAETNKDELE